jgi:hypothetical protein
MNIDSFLRNDQVNELLQKVFSFLDAQTLAKCRLVSRRFDANAQVRQLYSEEENKLRDAYEAYLKQQQKSTTEFYKMYEEKWRLRRTREHAQNNSPHTWLGWFVSIINSLTGIEATITGLLERIFPAIRVERARQVCVFNEIQGLKARENQVDERIREINLELDKPRTEYQNLKRVYIGGIIKKRNDRLDSLLAGIRSQYPRPLQIGISQKIGSSNVVSRQVIAAERPEKQKRIEHKIEKRQIFRTVLRPLFIYGKWKMSPKREFAVIHWCVVCNKPHK